MSEENDRMVQQLRIENVDAKNVTVVQQQNVNSDFVGKNAHKQRRRFHVIQKMLWDLLDALPDPKLKSLEKLVVMMVYEQFQNQQNVGGYLGLPQAKVSAIMRNEIDVSRVGERLWNKQNIQHTVPDDRMKRLEAGEEVKMTLPAEVDKLQEAIKSGAVIVREINRNEL